MSAQQEALYAAQATIDSGPHLSVEEAQRLVDAWRDAPWWAGVAPPTLLRVDVQEGTAAQTWGGVARWEPERNAGRIEIEQGGTTLLCLVHELAHIIANGVSSRKCGHGWFYARTYLTLTYHAMGSGTYTDLYTAFVKHGVAMDAP